MENGTWTQGSWICGWTRCSLVMGVALYADGNIIEDACWLRPIKDTQHINVAQLDAVLRGVSLALKWWATVMHVKTDYIHVYQLID